MRTVVDMATAPYGGFPRGLAKAVPDDGERASGVRTVVAMATAPYGGFPRGLAKPVPDVTLPVFSVLQVFYDCFSHIDAHFGLPTGTRWGPTRTQWTQDELRQLRLPHAPNTIVKHYHV